MLLSRFVLKRETRVHVVHIAEVAAKMEKIENGENPCEISKKNQNESFRYAIKPGWTKRFMNLFSVLWRIKF